MFSRRERVSRTLFPTIIKGGKRLSSPHFTAVVSQAHAGYAVVVSKKVARLSVTRHRIKRRVLEALRRHTLPTSLILFPKSSVATMTNDEIGAELTKLLISADRQTHAP